MNKKNKFKRVPPETRVSELSPLNISCGSTKCEDGLHCFSRHQKTALKKFGSTRVCYQCGTTLEDWDRVHKKDINDAEYVFNQLKKELVRHVYWHIEISPDDLNAANKKGIETIERETRNRIKRVLGISHPYRDGITPYEGNVIYYGQHATATCCRGCMEYWHNIPRGRELNDEEIEYCTKLIMLYVLEKIK
ncbi:MAG: DUF4186 family protein [Ignavibacteria bacterium]|nr:DUF4186 family protein [Ignavibacteria bacterium]